MRIYLASANGGSVDTWSLQPDIADTHVCRSHGIRKTVFRIRPVLEVELISVEVAFSNRGPIVTTHLVHTIQLDPDTESTIPIKIHDNFEVIWFSIPRYASIRFLTGQGFVHPTIISWFVSELVGAIKSQLPAAQNLEFKRWRATMSFVMYLKNPKPLIAW